MRAHLNIRGQRNPQMAKEAQLIGEKKDLASKGKLGPISSRVNKAEQYFSQSDADCSVTSCPELLKKDLEELFPSAPTSFITVVTVTQSQQENKETNQLLQKFVNGAKEMCFALWTAGYWADFIDPSTGAAFFASPSSQISLRTDEPLQDLGFHIEASGSCTVIRHILKGTPQFVGTVFTNAPPHSMAVARLQGLGKAHSDEE